MKFRTEIEILLSNDKISYHNSLFFIGSCFASNIGEESTKRGLRTMINPFGVTYNPLSISKIISYIEKGDSIEESMFRKVGNKWCSMMHHSSFDHESLEELKFSIKQSILSARQFIEESSFIFITLGTAWIYEDVLTGEVVNNCHKIAEKEFCRKRLSVAEIVALFSDMIKNSTTLKDKKIIFTISPIRHVKDTLQGNSLSKATLRTAVGELCDRHPEQLFYFPSYEIMMDDLRDYRFYEKDMIHPSGVAIEYIFEKFETCFFSKQTSEYAAKMEKITRAMAHRVVDESSNTYQQFLKTSLISLFKIKEEFPQNDYTDKINFFNFAMTKK